MFLRSWIRIIVRIVLVLVSIQIDRWYGVSFFSFLLLFLFHRSFQKSQIEWLFYTAIVDILSFRPPGLTVLLIEVLLALTSAVWTYLPVFGKKRVHREVM